VYDKVPGGKRISITQKSSIRFLIKLCIPPRHAQTNLSPGEFTSLVESADFKVGEIQHIGDKTEPLYLN